MARGFTQVSGIDFNEVLLAMIACLNLNLEQMDVITAFLHGNLDERIFMEQPKGFESREKVE